MCVTDHYDITLAVKVALNPNATNQPILKDVILSKEIGWFVGSMVFNALFNIISVLFIISSAPIHVFLKFFLTLYPTTTFWT